jgi:hypothetical protein
MITEGKIFIGERLGFSPKEKAGLNRTSRFRKRNTLGNPCSFEKNLMDDKAIEKG